MSMLSRFDVRKGKVQGTAYLPKPRPGEASRAKCPCGGDIHRSHRTGILHRYCYLCRYLRMIYGPSISIRRIG